uniref:BPTI/Kunitz inhibitor domain-containing protein n=1 Tax=Amblyomma americanum TaxID=6943 RepID=A0A0C9R3T6_AMBAM
MRVLLVAAFLFTACAAFFYDESPGATVCFDPDRQEECKELCRTVPEDSPCRALIPAWFFNGLSCQEFTYGGCGDDLNNFDTREECMNACGKYNYSLLDNV